MAVEGIAIVETIGQRDRVVVVLCADRATSTVDMLELNSSIRLTMAYNTRRRV